MEKRILRTLDEKQKTRKLYVETFHMESSFTDFYYGEKCKDNLIYALEENGETVSMLHLNPYTAILNCYPGHQGKGGDNTEHIVNTYYMTSAATLPQYRGQGNMDDLLTDAIRDLYAAKVPFVYLRPVSEETFKPYQFRYIWDRQAYQLNPDIFPKNFFEQVMTGKVSIQGRPKETLEVSIVQPDEYVELTSFMNQYCYDNYGLFMRRTETYISRMCMAYPTRGGNVYIIRQENGGAIQGYFFCKKESYGKIEIRECAILPKYEDIEIFQAVGEKEPWVMARVIHLRTLLQNIHSKKSVDIVMKVTDPIIKENNGTYLLRTSIFGTKIERMTKSHYENMWEDEQGRDHPEEIATTVDKLLSYVFGYKAFEECFEILSSVKGIEDEISYKVKCLRPYGQAFINEMV